MASLMILVAAGAYFGARYRIGIDDQRAKCLPPYMVFLIDTWDRNPRRGELVAFRARGIGRYVLHGDPAIRPLAARYTDGTWFVKVVAGVPGDRVEVTRKETTVNGAAVGTGLALARSLGRDVASFERRIELPQGRFWVMGRSVASVDSRYWGCIDQTQVIGTAQAIW
ncbi:MAG: signal peptidase I [Gammaproteobacteria bacterium]